MRRERLFDLCVAVAIITLRPGLVRAADTVETWDAGAANVDFYMGLDGIGAKENDRTVYGDIMLGFGIVERFSVYIGTTLQANGQLTQASPDLYLGVFGTPIDTRLFDIDLFLGVSAGGPGMSELRVSPAVEVNLDSLHGFWGLYVRAGLVGYGRTGEKASGSSEGGLAFDVEVNPGGYVTVAEGHQILLEYDMSLHPDPETGPSSEVGGVTLGYNVVLSDALELITQVYLDLPEDGQVAGTGLMVGFVGTIPMASQSVPDERPGLVYRGTSRRVPCRSVLSGNSHPSVTATSRSSLPSWP